MAKRIIQRDYNMTDAELCMFTSNLCMFLERDLADIGKFGLTQLQIDALKALGDAFEVFPNDDAYLGDVMIAVDAKNVLMEQVKETIRDMLLRVELKWGVESGEYKNLTGKGMNFYSEKEILTTSRQIHLKCTDYLADLAAYGLTQLMLDDMAALNESLEQAMNLVDDKKAIRDKKTYERITNGNEIYDYVVAYCDMGKRTYVKSDPAKYDEYVIYDSTQIIPSQIVGLAYNQTTGELSWTADPDAEEYEAAFTPEQVGEEIWINFWTGSGTSTIYNPGGPENYKFKVRGIHGTNKGPWSEVLLVIRV